MTEQVEPQTGQVWERRGEVRRVTSLREPVFVRFSRDGHSVATGWFAWRLFAQRARLISGPGSDAGVGK